MKLALLFGLSMLIAGGMINPEGLHPWGLLAYAAIMLILMPFMGWPILLQAGVFPPTGESRTRSVLATWIGGTLVAVSVIFWIASLLAYDPTGRRIDQSGHLFIPYWRRLGIALGLFGICMLVACGIVGAVAPILRREVALRAALIGGSVLFAVVYALGCALVAG